MSPLIRSRWPLHWQMSGTVYTGKYIKEICFFISGIMKASPPPWEGESSRGQVLPSCANGRMKKPVDPSTHSSLLWSSRRESMMEDRVREKGPRCEEQMAGRRLSVGEKHKRWWRTHEKWTSVGGKPAIVCSVLKLQVLESRIGPAAPWCLCDLTAKLCSQYQTLTVCAVVGFYCFVAALIPVGVSGVDARCSSIDGDSWQLFKNTTYGKKWMKFLDGGWNAVMFWFRCQQAGFRKKKRCESLLDFRAYLQQISPAVYFFNTSIQRGPKQNQTSDFLNSNLRNVVEVHVNVVALISGGNLQGDRRIS